MEEKSLSPLKTILNSPIKTIPSVPKPDWTAVTSTSTGNASKQIPHSSLSFVPPAAATTTDLASSIQLQNCVATINLGCQLDLTTINFRTRNSEYNPARFNGVVMRIREPRTTALIFHSGKIVCTGARNEQDAFLASKKFARIIQKIGFPVRFHDFKIHNLLATCDLRFPIKLELLHDAHFQFSSYEPELFPGLIYRMVKPRLVLMIFVNGKIVFTGAKTRQDINDALKNIYEVLKSYEKI